MGGEWTAPPTCMWLMAGDSTRANGGRPDLPATNCARRELPALALRDMGGGPLGVRAAPAAAAAAAILAGMALLLTAARVDAGPFCGVCVGANAGDLGALRALTAPGPEDAAGGDRAVTLRCVTAVTGPRAERAGFAANAADATCVEAAAEEDDEEEDEDECVRSCLSLWASSESAMSAAACSDDSAVSRSASTPRSCGRSCSTSGRFLARRPASEAIYRSKLPLPGVEEARELSWVGGSSSVAAPPAGRAPPTLTGFANMLEPAAGDFATNLVRSAEAAAALAAGEAAAGDASVAAAGEETGAACVVAIAGLTAESAGGAMKWPASLRRPECYLPEFCARGGGDASGHETAEKSTPGVRLMACESQIDSTLSAHAAEAKVGEGGESEWQRATHAPQVR